MNGAPTMKRERRTLIAIGKASAKVLAGNTSAAVIGLVSFALTARALGPHDFGVLLILVASSQTAGRVVGFQSWHALIRYAPELGNATSSSRESYFTLVRYACILDVIGALTAALCFAAAAWVVLAIVGWAIAPLDVALLFCIPLLLRVHGAALGVMRLSDKFGALALQTVLVAAFKLALTAWAYVEGAGLAAFAVIWAVTLSAEYLGAAALAYHTLAVQGFRTIGPARLPDSVDRAAFWHLHVNANLWSGAQSLRELDTLVVAAALSPAALALYRAGRDLCLKLNRLLDPLVVVAYPYFARAYADGRGDDLHRLFRATALASGAVGLCAIGAYWCLGKYLIEGIFGSEFAGAFVPGLVFMAAFAATAIGKTAQPAAVATDKANRGLVATTLLVPPFLAASFVLSVYTGVLGAAVAFLAHSIATTIAVVAIASKRSR
jgi:O-antigen/teichoic acid export membrane protein